MKERNLFEVGVLSYHTCDITLSGNIGILLMFIITTLMALIFPNIVAYEYKRVCVSSH